MRLCLSVCLYRPYYIVSEPYNGRATKVFKNKIGDGGGGQKDPLPSYLKCL